MYATKAYIGVVWGVSGHIFHTWSLWVGIQSYLRFEGRTEVGAISGSSHTEPEEVRLEP